MQQPAAGTVHQLRAWAAGAAPRVAFRTNSIFPNKQAHKYLSILNLTELQAVPSDQFNSPAHPSCLTCCSTSSLSPLSLMGTCLEILHRYHLSQTKGSLNISHYLPLATLVIALEGKILTTEHGAVQFRCPTGPPGLDSPANETAEPVTRAAGATEPIHQSRDPTHLLESVRYFLY